MIAEDSINLAISAAEMVRPKAPRFSFTPASLRKQPFARCQPMPLRRVERGHSQFGCHAPGSGHSPGSSVDLHRLFYAVFMPRAYLRSRFLKRRRFTLSSRDERSRRRQRDTKAMHQRLAKLRAIPTGSLLRTPYVRPCDARDRPRLLCRGLLLPFRMRPVVSAPWRSN